MDIYIAIYWYYFHLIAFGDYIFRNITLNTNICRINPLNPCKSNYDPLQSIPIHYYIIQPSNIWIYIAIYWYYIQLIALGDYTIEYSDFTSSNTNIRIISRLNLEQTFYFGGNSVPTKFIVDWKLIRIRSNIWIL